MTLSLPAYSGIEVTPGVREMEGFDRCGRSTEKILPETLARIESRTLQTRRPINDLSQVPNDNNIVHHAPCAPLASQ